jgi:hypothetical protein
MKPNKKRFSLEQNCLPLLLSLDWQTNKVLNPIEAELLVVREISVSFVHPTVCFTTGQLPLPERVLQTVRSSASSFNFQYPVFSLGWSSICLAYIVFLVFPSLLSFPLSALIGNNTSMCDSQLISEIRNIFVNSVMQNRLQWRWFW